SVDSADRGKPSLIEQTATAARVGIRREHKSQDAQKGRPARSQRLKKAEVKVEQRSDSFHLHLNLSLNLNLPESWRAFSASCQKGSRYDARALGAMGLSRLCGCMGCCPLVERTSRCLAP